MMIFLGVVFSMLATVFACWLTMKLDKSGGTRGVFNKAKVKYFDGDNT